MATMIKILASRLLLVLALLSGLTQTPLYAQTTDDAFIITGIELRGNQRIETGAVINYLPLKTGDEFDPSRDTARAIRALYDTGLFEDIKLYHRDDKLIVELEERPIIAELQVTGNAKVDDDLLLESLRNEGIYRGRVFNRSVLETMQREINRLYTSIGYYSIRLETEVTALDRNRVAIAMTISEGEVAAIRHISIIGNQVFSDEELLDLLESGIESGSIFSSAGEYSRAKLEGDMETLRSYYLDRGYLQFAIDSTQVSISPDKSDIYITMNVSEGERFTVSEIALAGDSAVVPKEELQALLQLSAGDVFSRQALIRSRDAMVERFGEEGYAFATINVGTQPDLNSNTVEVILNTTPGKRVYVNRITFSGQSGTSDHVFRREMRLIEGGRFSPALLERSRVRLQRLRFIRGVTVRTSRVAGSDDLIDIEMILQEGASGSFTLGLGVSSDGLLFNGSIDQDNFLGTGNRVRFSAERSTVNRELSAEYGESYYTVDGISRSINAFLREQNASELSETIDFITDSYGIGLRFGIPLSEYTSLRLGIGYENVQVRETGGTPAEISQFILDNGDEYNIVESSLRLSRDTRNRTVFAEDGTLQRFNITLAVPGSDLEYYRLGYAFEFYQALSENLVFSISNRLDYGEGYGEQERLPFFKRYYAGGVRSLRGFRQRSLGPRDSTGDAAGGDFRTLNTIEFIFPPTLDKQSETRLSLFTDFGNVYADYDSFDSDELRATYGISFVWLSAIGPLTFSYAVPYESEPEDLDQSLQFTFGSVF